MAYLHVYSRVAIFMKEPMPGPIFMITALSAGFIMILLMIWAGAFNDLELRGR